MSPPEECSVRIGLCRSGELVRVLPDLSSPCHVLPLANAIRPFSSCEWFLETLGAEKHPCCCWGHHGNLEEEEAGAGSCAWWPHSS